jgi:bifunctional polynucleotide phosphatase/kinase
VDPSEILKKHAAKAADTTTTTTPAQSYHSDTQEMVLFVGAPASGKSTLFKRFFKAHNYVQVNRDLLQTQEKCLKAAEQAIKEGKSVCVDNTNPSKRVRAEYIQLAKRHSLTSIRCIKLKTPLELCHHLNYVR